MHTDQQQEKVETHRGLVTSLREDVYPFVVTALALHHLPAKQVRAFRVREKPRDLHGVWLLLRQGGSLI